MLILLKKTKRIRKSEHKNTKNDRWGRMIREEKNDEYPINIKEEGGRQEEKWEIKK